MAVVGDPENLLHGRGGSLFIVTVRHEIERRAHRGAERDHAEDVAHVGDPPAGPEGDRGSKTLRHSHQPGGGAEVEACFPGNRHR